MLQTLAIENYRSLLKLVIPLGRLTIITGHNGSGKSNLYKALRLLADTVQGGVVNSVAREGGLHSTFWAGPENLSRRMRSGEVPVQGSISTKVKRLKLGFASEDFGYSISLGLPTPSTSAFSLDPEIKKECIWAGSVCRPASVLVDRTGPVVKTRNGRSWDVLSDSINQFDSMLGEVAHSGQAPEVFTIREMIRGWRFYDHFRTDREAATRLPQLGTRTPVLYHDGRDLAAALQTIYEIGDGAALNQAIDEAFPDACLGIKVDSESRFSVELSQKGLLRPMTTSEMSDGTLRYLLWIAALLTPRPPAMMVLNEPETSLHPDLLPALAKTIIRASQHTQLWVISHAAGLISELTQHADASLVQLEKQLGQTELVGQDLQNTPAWQWPD